MFDQASCRIARHHGPGIKAAKTLKKREQVGPRDIKNGPAVGLFRDAGGVRDEVFYFGGKIGMIGQGRHQEPLINPRPDGSHIPCDNRMTRLRQTISENRLDKGAKFLIFTLSCGKRGNRETGIFAYGNAADRLDHRGVHSERCQWSK